MENTNTQAGAPVTPAASTPASSTPMSSTSTAPVTGKKKNTTATIIGIIVLIAALIIINVISQSVSKKNAEKKLNETIAICEENGILSQACKDSQEKNKVSCNMITGDCTIEYTYRMFW